ncbi:MAG: acyltransferase [Roseburia sp.]|nr:acyltransferase [Roseburia sp.]MCM1278263.1 acyltransferase [Robinsoniella sp.]
MIKTKESAQSRKERTRDSSLDAVKGFAIVLVMLGHCIVKNDMVDPVKDPYVYDVIKAIEMPLFMMISGYLAGLSKRRASLKEAAYTIRKRAVSYLVPFFVWLFLSNLFSGKPAPIQALKDVLFHLDWGLWFLMTLFLITVLVLLAECFPKAWQSAVFLLAAYVLFFLQSRTGNSFLSPHLTVRYMPYYMAGFLVSRYLLPLKKDGNKWLLLLMGQKTLWGLWAISLAGFIWLIVRYDMVTVHSTKELLCQMIASLLGSYVCFFGIYRFYEARKVPENFAKNVQLLKSPFLAQVGLYTLEIYVLHFRFVRMLGFYKRGYSLYSLEGIGVVLASFLVMSVLTWLIIALVKKVPFLDFLLFGKSHPRR